MLIWWNTSRCAQIVLVNQNNGMSGTTTFIVYICGLHVSTYTQVIVRPSCTYESIKSYAWWDHIVLTSLEHINYVKCLCLSVKVKIRIAVFTLRWCRIRYADLSYHHHHILLSLQGHRASTKCRHLILFLASCLTSPQLFPSPSASLWTDLLHVCLGLPLFR